jgi:hypothetical protein
MRFSDWLYLLRENRFRVAPASLYAAGVTTLFTLLSSGLSVYQRLFFGRRINNTVIRHAPIFIIGHWRTGTTFLHELLALDEQHTYLNNYGCVAPHHFLRSERYVGRFSQRLMLRRRMMDSMAIGWDRPQEDEYALCNLGVPSVYRAVAFPSALCRYQRHLDLESLEPADVERWKRTFLRLLQELTLREPKRLVLKSPPHAYRIKLLLEMFPDARFVHMVRNPYAVFASTMHMWMSMFETQSLDTADGVRLEEFVFENFARMHQRLEATRHLVAPERFYEMRYDSLVADPFTAIQQLYEALQLDSFNDRYRARLSTHLAAVADYQPNTYTLTAELRAKINRRWSAYFRKYGYEMEQPTRKYDR